MIFAEDVEAIFGKRPWASRSEEIMAENESNEIKSIDSKNNDIKELPSNNESNTQNEE